MKERKPNKKKEGDLDLILESLPDENKERRQRQRIKRQLEEEEVLREEEKRRARVVCQEEPSMNRRKGRKRKKSRMSNKEITRVTYMFVTLFLVMIGYMVYFNVVKSKDVINSPYNVRQNLLAERIVRGKILDKHGNTLAQTIVNEDGSEYRDYPYGALYSHVVGYSAKGKAGIELTQNFNLLTSNAFFLEKISNEFRDQKNMGDTVITTLDTKLQSSAAQALGNHKGAVVVMEASTGKILAMVSKPDFDANKVAQNWETLIQDPNSALLNRATQGQYAPGSVFKVVTALSFMRQQEDYESFSYNCTGEISKDGTTIQCYGHKAHGEENLASALANSCNTAFSQIGLQLDVEKWKATAEDLLFNQALKCELPAKSGRFSLKKESNSAERMMTAMGQGDTLVSPYHMALITASIANGGTLMKPYLVDQITNYEGSVVKKYMPEKYTELMSSKEAAALAEYMKDVVNYGTGTALSGGSYTVAGKTGTAEVSMDKEMVHSWFMGFTNVDHPELVISVVVEHADTSQITGVSVAKKVLDSYYN